MKIPTFCTVTSLVGLALASNSTLESTRMHQVLQDHHGVVCVPDLVAEGAVLGTPIAAAPLPDNPEVPLDDPFVARP